MLYELVDMTNWKTKKEILKELQDKDIILDEREFRKRVKKNNERFNNHEIDFYIAHSNKGYKKTTDFDEIKRSCEDKRKRSLDQLHEVSKTLKAIGENCNMRLEITNDSFTYTKG